MKRYFKDLPLFARYDCTPAEENLQYQPASVLQGIIKFIVMVSQYSKIFNILLFLSKDFYIINMNF